MNDITICETSYEVHSCITCGVIYALPKAVANQQRQQGGYHFCTNGHSQGWDKGHSEFEKMRLERDRLKQDIARADDERREALATANAQLERANKAEAKAKRLTKRAAAGTCPCCKRTFKELSEHMKHQHPGFVTDTGAKVIQIKRGAAA